MTTARVGQGLLGLLLDARYGILPYVPVFAARRGGARPRRGARLCAGAAGRRRLLPDRRHRRQLGGAGLQPRPLRHAGGAPGGGARGRGAGPRRLAPGALCALALVLRLLVAALRSGFWRGPASRRTTPRCSSRRATFADGNQYIPDLFIRTLGRRGARALGADRRLAGRRSGSTTFWLRRVGPGERGGAPAGASAGRTLAAAAVLLLATAWLLERWPAARVAPSSRRGRSRRVAPGPSSSSDGAGARPRGRGRFSAPGRVELHAAGAAGGRRRCASWSAVAVLLRVPGLAPVVLRPTGALVSLPLSASHVVQVPMAGTWSGASGRSRSSGGQAVLRPIEHGGSGAAVGVGDHGTRGGWVR